MNTWELDSGLAMESFDSIALRLRRLARTQAAQKRLLQRLRKIQPGPRLQPVRVGAFRASSRVSMKLATGGSARVQLQPKLAPLSGLNKLRAVSNSNDLAQAKVSAAQGQAIAELQVTLEMLRLRQILERLKKELAALRRLAKTEHSVTARVDQASGARVHSQGKLSVRWSRTARLRQFQALTDSVSLGGSMPTFVANWDRSKGALEGRNATLILSLFGSILVGWGGSALLGDSPWSLLPRLLPLGSTLAASRVVKTPSFGVEVAAGTVPAMQTTLTVELGERAGSDVTVGILNAAHAAPLPGGIAASPTSPRIEWSVNQGKLVFTNTTTYWAFSAAMHGPPSSSLPPPVDVVFSYAITSS